VKRRANTSRSLELNLTVLIRFDIGESSIDIQRGVGLNDDTMRPIGDGAETTPKCKVRLEKTPKRYREIYDEKLKFKPRNLTRGSLKYSLQPSFQLSRPPSPNIDGPAPQYLLVPAAVIKI
jgi:hypothetical protein